MFRLASCWFIIEAFLIPDGFLKWFFLSFYIHPIFLFFCQIFLWLNFILNYFSLIFLFTLKIISFVCSYVSKSLKNCVNLYVFSSARLTSHSDQIVQKYSNTDLIIPSNSYLSLVPTSCQLKIYNYEEHIFQNDQVSSYEDDSSSIYGSETSDQYMPSSSSSSSICSSDSSVADNRDMDECSSLILISSRSLPENGEIGNEYSAYICSFNSLAMVEREEVNGYCDEDQDLDEFYEKYTQRMGWFDVLNHDRTFALSAILKNNEVDESPISSNGSVDNNPYKKPWMSETEKKRIIRSIKREMEIVYVAQTCLSWEALHHQYLKVEAFAESSRGKGVFYNNVAANFQKFQVVLERFMEDERCLGKRVENYVGRRFHLTTFLQVPQVSGFIEEEREEMKNEGTSVREVVKGIERCIEAFWIFVKTDIEKNKAWWKLSSSPAVPVEDPRDLYLFAHLTAQFRKKELLLKDLQGKQKCWIRRVEEWETKEILLAKIEMKLISRVLQMPLLSSSQLKWCQQKLDTIHFLRGKIIRSSSTCCLLFPP